MWLTTTTRPSVVASRKGIVASRLRSLYAGNTELITSVNAQDHLLVYTPRRYCTSSRLREQNRGKITPLAPLAASTRRSRCPGPAPTASRPIGFVRHDSARVSPKKISRSARDSMPRRLATGRPARALQARDSSLVPLRCWAKPSATSYPHQRHPDHLLSCVSRSGSRNQTWLDCWGCRPRPGQ